MSKEIIKIDEITKTVSDLTKFEMTCDSLKKEVKKTSDITVDNLEDTAQIERVKRGRIDLRNIEIDIEKQGKGYRDVFTQVNKNIMAKQNELLAITNPEFNRLKDLEDQAKAIETRKEREKLLPYRKEKLAEVDNETDDEILLEMDDKQFGEYLMEKTEDKNEKERIAKEEKEREAQKQKEIKEVRENEKKKVEEKAKIEIERVKQEAKDKEVRIAREKKEAEDKAKIEIERVKQEAKDKEVRIAREKKEAEDKKIEDEKRLNKEKDYKKFLSDNGYEEGSTDLRKITENGEVKLYKLVATYKIK